MLENVGALTSRNPKGLHGLYRITLPLPYSSTQKKEAICSSETPALSEPHGFTTKRQ
jgi:hypothetical protein